MGDEILDLIEKLRNFQEQKKTEVKVPLNQEELDLIIDVLFDYHHDVANGCA